MPEETSISEQYRNHSPLEGFDAGAQNATPVGSHSPECVSQHGLREGTGGHPDDSRDTRPDRATRFVETAFGILSYSQLAPLLGERVTHLEESVQAEEFRSSPLDENLLLEFHRRICGDLTPDWSGKWRTLEVTVGPLTPPVPHQLPMLMRDYALDLQARWDGATTDDMELALEFLAFAEGRFLVSTHSAISMDEPSASFSPSYCAASIFPSSISPQKKRRPVPSTSQLWRLPTAATGNRSSPYGANASPKLPPSIRNDRI